MRSKRRMILLPLLVFLVGIGVLGNVVYNIKENQKAERMKAAELNAMTYAERMKNDFLEAVGATGTLEEILVSENGEIDKFPEVAADMMTDAIQSIQIAPQGVVTDIYPAEGNEAGKIDLLQDEDRGEISRYARDKKVLVMQGPFELKQGGSGIAVRNPVYLKDEAGQEYFWGFTIVIIRVPDVFSDSLKALSGFGYQYRLSKTISPWETKYEEVYSSDGKLEDGAYYSLDMGGDKWKLEVMPQAGWYDKASLQRSFIGGFLIVILLTGLTLALLRLEGRRDEFKKIAVTDSLTGIYNRQGFEESVKRYLKKNQDSHCVLAELDIDDFKFINDMYGHADGDMALQVLTDTMHQMFPEKAILGRIGGDEFYIFLQDVTGEEVEEQLRHFTKMERYIYSSGEKHEFCISLGYARYPVHASTYEQLKNNADAALYEVKLQGKNGCMEYREGLHKEIRTSLGFAIQDVSENLPGAFIIYKADKVDDEILFANDEFIRMAGCNNMSELMAYTKGSFRNLVWEEERADIEQSIWKQIEKGNSNDYVLYHLKKQDGSLVQVMDHGRIVENNNYGKVFYVLFMNLEFVKTHYEPFFTCL